jgi:hypothetical protein
MRLVVITLTSVLLSGCGAAAPMVLSAIGGGLTIAKDVLDVDVSLRQLIDLKRQENQQTEPQKMIAPDLPPRG